MMERVLVGAYGVKPSYCIVEGCRVLSWNGVRVLDLLLGCVAMDFDKKVHGTPGGTPTVVPQYKKN
jgi:hypothetical protein